MKIKTIDTELPDLIKEIIEHKKKLFKEMSRQLGIPKNKSGRRSHKKK